MLLTGRIAGISGIFAGCLGSAIDDKSWRIAFIVGLLMAPLLGGLLGYPIPSPQMPASWGIIAGLLVGFGTRLPTKPVAAQDRDRPPARDRIGAVRGRLGSCGTVSRPALENLATLSPRVIAFVIAMATGMVVHDFWQTHHAAATQ